LAKESASVVHSHVKTIIGRGALILNSDEREVAGKGKRGEGEKYS
jgi:hypothetical protein